MSNPALRSTPDAAFRLSGSPIALRNARLAWAVTGACGLGLGDGSGLGCCSKVGVGGGRGGLST